MIRGLALARAGPPRIDLPSRSWGYRVGHSLGVGMVATSHDSPSVVRRRDWLSADSPTWGATAVPLDPSRPEELAVP